MSTDDPSAKPKKPKKPAAVAEALVREAAAAYVAGRSLSQREIAKAAGVNHGQIHHLFGGKSGLKAAMFDHLASELDRQVRDREPGDISELMQAAVVVALKDRRFVRALAREIVEEGSDGHQQCQFPVVRGLQAAMASSPNPKLADELPYALATTLGWAFFGPWIQQAAGLDEDQAEKVEQTLANVDRWVKLVAALQEKES